jgi:hypothetical protein
MFNRTIRTQAFRARNTPVPHCLLAGNAVQSKHLGRTTLGRDEGRAGWTQNNGYDGNGNRALTFSSSNLPFVTNETPTGTSSYLATNRIIGYTYDAAGNVLQAGNTVRSFKYDAENRQV